MLQLRRVMYFVMTYAEEIGGLSSVETPAPENLVAARVLQLRCVMYFVMT